MENTNKKIDKFYLEDGRVAERHSFVNESGDQVVEQFVEPERNLDLSKRVITKKKEVVAEQRIETIKNGEVVDVVVNSIEPNVKLELRDHIRTESYANRGDYVTKAEIGHIVSEAVVAGITPVIQSLGLKAQDQQPNIKAQDIIQKNIEEKKNNSWKTIAGYSAIAAIQIGVLIWLVLW